MPAPNWRTQRDPKVHRELDNWWNAIALADGVHQDPYFRMHQRISRTLIPDISEDMVVKILREEWSAVKGTNAGGSLNREEFFDQLFELAGIWTHQKDLQEYYDFLTDLRPYAFDGHGGQKKPERLQRWRKDSSKDDAWFYQQRQSAVHKVPRIAEAVCLGQASLCSI